MRSTKRILIIPPLLFMLAFAGACKTTGVVTAPGKTPQPVLDNIAVQFSQAADGAKATRKIKETLLAEGKITKETSNGITKALIKIDTSVKVANEKLGTYESFTPTAKADLTKLYTDIKSARAELITAGVVPANSGVDKALLIIDAALAALEIFLK